MIFYVQKKCCESLQLCTKFTFDGVFVHDSACDVKHKPGRVT